MLPLKFFATSSLIAYLGFMILGSIHLIHMAEMHMPMQDCPFIQLQKTLCLSDVTTHLETLKDMSQYPIIFVFVYVVFIAAFFFILTYQPPSLLLRRIYSKTNAQRRYSIYLELFSKGILNSKYF